MYFKDFVNGMTEQQMGTVKIGELTINGKGSMKTYPTATEALIDYLHYLKEHGEFNSRVLHEKMLAAKVKPDEMISESLFRMLLLGKTLRLVEHRAVAACRVLGIQVAVINTQVPENYKRKNS